MGDDNDGYEFYFDDKLIGKCGLDDEVYYDFINLIKFSKEDYDYSKSVCIDPIFTNDGLTFDEMIAYLSK
jgi:hypothetical protein